jgi:hypothetical protein
LHDAYLRELIRAAEAGGHRELTARGLCAALGLR